MQTKIVSCGVRTHAQLPAVDLKSTPLTTRANCHWVNIESIPLSCLSLPLSHSLSPSLSLSLSLSLSCFLAFLWFHLLLSRSALDVLVLFIFRKLLVNVWCCCFSCSVLRIATKSDPGRTRTCNLWFRRPTPYPLGHRASQIASSSTL